MQECLKIKRLLAKAFHSLASSYVCLDTHPKHCLCSLKVWFHFLNRLFQASAQSVAQFCQQKMFLVLEHRAMLATAVSIRA